ncbi:MAG: MATE family efflux transporter [Chloroflexi bacterium]|nr:MATE family efflux transporter [Chloroflexota bacterium]
MQEPAGIPVRSHAPQDGVKTPAPDGPIAFAHGGPRRRRPTHLDRKLTEGSIPKNIFFLAWPQVVSGALQAIDHLADLVWAGFIGSRAIASIGVAQSWSQLAATARMGLDTAARAMVSRAVGAENMALANHVAMQSFLLSGTVSLTLCVLGILFTELLLWVLGVSEGIIAQGASYMRWQFVASFTIALLMMTSSVLQASGDALTPMKAQVVNRVLHLVLSPLLVFGWGVFPELGLPGAAIANAIAQATGAAINGYILFTGRSRLHLSLHDARPDFPLLWRMVRLGGPSSVTSMERSLAQVILVGLVTPFGDLALAAYSITNRVQMFVNLGSMGLGQSCGILVGQNLGAQQPDRARATVWWALGYVVLVNLVVGGLILLFPYLFLLLFTRESQLLEVAVPWLQIQVLGFIVMGAGMVFMQTFNTAGDTSIPMVVTLVTIWGIQQPAAIMLSGVAQHWELFGWAVAVPTIGDLGQFGIAWAIVLAMAARLLIYFPYFLWGPWLKKQVF